MCGLENKKEKSRELVERGVRPCSRATDDTVYPGTCTLSYLILLYTTRYDLLLVFIRVSMCGVWCVGCMNDMKQRSSRDFYFSALTLLACGSAPTAPSRALRPTPRPEARLHCEHIPAVRTVIIAYGGSLPVSTCHTAVRGRVATACKECKPCERAKNKYVGSCVPKVLEACFLRGAHVVSP